jgi:hypothetical protein
MSDHTLHGRIAGSFHRQRLRGRIVRVVRTVVGISRLH